MWMVGLGATRLSREEPHHPRRPPAADSLLVGHPGLPRSEADIRFLGGHSCPPSSTVHDGVFQHAIKSVAHSSAQHMLGLGSANCRLVPGERCW